eukprot:97724-Rhodomonas_salina.3
MAINAIRPEYWEKGKARQPTAFQGNYWFYHHTHADLMETVDSAQVRPTPVEPPKARSVAHDGLLGGSCAGI